jgi:hypothetical protein
MADMYAEICREKQIKNKVFIQKFYSTNFNEGNKNSYLEFQKK